MVNDALNQSDAASNSTNSADPGGIGPLVKSSISGMRGNARTPENYATACKLWLSVFVCVGGLVVRATEFELIL